MAVLTKRITTRELSKESFRQKFPEFTRAYTHLDQLVGGRRCSSCASSRPAFEAVVSALKKDRDLANRLRVYLGFEFLEVVEKIGTGVTKTRLAG